MANFIPVDPVQNPRRSAVSRRFQSTDRSRTDVKTARLKDHGHNRESCQQVSTSRLCSFP